VSQPVTLTDAFVSPVSSRWWVFRANPDAPIFVNNGRRDSFAPSSITYAELARSSSLGANSGCVTASTR
jgi:hypothetical protein